MKTASVVHIKKEINFKSREELIAICLHLARFKKENKELLTYLLFEADDEENYRNSIRNWMDEEFKNINTKNFFYVKKSARKILTQTKKFIRYSKNKETMVVLLLHFCKNLFNLKPSITQSTRLQNMFDSQIAIIKKTLQSLHADLQFDYQLELNNLLDEK